MMVMYVEHWQNRTESSYIWQTQLVISSVLYVHVGVLFVYMLA